MLRCLLSLGSNLGEREEHLRAGIAGLAARGVRPTRCASVYSTEPRDLLDQPWFLNTAVEVETTLELDQLIRVCLEVEQSRDRQRSTPNGPRTLDVDIILAEDRIVRSDHLIIPHPRYATRRFVLEPLAEIAPEMTDPLTGETIANTLRRLDDASTVSRVAPPLC
jgi:2-amino-4-hydroxy-6-hydroxymethyldihydropteridine diphosphokinase